MATYFVDVYELYVQTYEVEADTPEEAADEAMTGEASYENPSFLEVAEEYSAPVTIDGKEIRIRGIRGIQKEEEYYELTS